MKNILQQDL